MSSHFLMQPAAFENFQLQFCELSLSQFFKCTAYYRFFLEAVTKGQLILKANFLVLI